MLEKIKKFLTKKNLEKLRKKIINKKIIENTLLFFLIMQPLFDLYFLFDEKIVNILGFSPSTIFRIILVGIIGILFIFTLKNKKEFYMYYIYIGIVVLYTICHHINALNFTDFYKGYDFGYNLTSELFYFIRMLMPLFLIIVSAHYKFDDKYLERLIGTLIILTCGSIIVTNLLEISTGSYSKEIIKGNIFCWFQENRCYLNYMDLASKGFFLDPNRLSALLVLITPLMMYISIKNPSIKNRILVIINWIGMLMIGTKVSTYGFLLILICSIIVFLFFCFIKKEISFKISTAIFMMLIVIINVVVLPYSPAINRTMVDNQVQSDYNNNVDGKLEENTEKLSGLIEKIEEKEEIKKDKENLADKKTEEEGKNEELTEQEEIKKQEEINKKEEKLNNEINSFIEANYLNYNINPHFILNSYPYKYDPEFWIDIMNMPINQRTNFRIVERLMLERVKDKNDNMFDNIFGITFTRMGNIFDLERDFISHYYTLGFLGLIIFLFPYIIITLVCGIKMMVKYKDYFTMKNVFILMGIGITLFAAFFTGNVMDGLIVTLLLGVIFGQLINGCFKIEKIK